MRDRSRFPLPAKVEVKGSWYSIKVVNKLKDDDGKECLGLHDHEDKVISINASCKGSEKRKTFLHELAHAYIFECHIREGLDLQLEEVIIESIVCAFDKEFDIKWKKRK